MPSLYVIYDQAIKIFEIPPSPLVVDRANILSTRGGGRIKLKKKKKKKIEIVYLAGGFDK